MRTRTARNLRRTAFVISVLLPFAVATPAAADALPSATPAVDCFGNPLPPSYPGLPGTVIHALPGIPTYGTPGDDIIMGTSGPDSIFAYGGDDIICGGQGNDIIYAGLLSTEDTDADQVDGENGSDEIHGGDDNDLLRGGALDDTIYGDDGGDTIYGGPGPDYILCGGNPGDWADGGTYVVGGVPDYDRPTVGNGCMYSYNIP